MKSKSMLFLMELIVVILFFSLSAAISLKIFAEARTMSNEGRDFGKASVISQSCAEVYKNQKGNISAVSEILGGTKKDNSLEFYYDNEWDECSESNSTFTVIIRECEKKSSIVTARISSLKNGIEFYSVDVASIL